MTHTTDPTEPAPNYLEVIVDALEWWGCDDALGAAGRVVDRLKKDGFVIVNKRGVVTYGY